MSSTRRDAAERIHSAAIHLLRRVREVDDEAMGVSPARASALSVLVFGGPCSLTTLARAERVTAATMSRLVKGMEADGFVRRERDASDGRAVLLAATTKGRRILERGRARRLDLLEELLAEASGPEVEAVHTAADVVQRALASG
jgi:DNA-binding MarR family transcriptional regulator